MNTMLLVGGISLMLGAGIYWFANQRPKTPLLSDTHLLELNTELEKLFHKEYNPDNPTIFRTNQGLLVSYMHQHNEHVFLHNVSLTVQDATGEKWTPQIQQYFIQFISNRFKTIPYAVHLSEKKVLAITFLLENEEKHQAFLNNLNTTIISPWKLAQKNIDVAINSVNTDELSAKNASNNAMKEDVNNEDLLEVDNNQDQKIQVSEQV